MIKHYAAAFEMMCYCLEKEWDSLDEWCIMWYHHWCNKTIWHKSRIVVRSSGQLLPINHSIMFNTLHPSQGQSVCL